MPSRLTFPVNIFPSRIFYLNLPTVFKVLYFHCIRHIGFRRFFVALIYLFIVVVMSAINILFRLADEIFFPAYRKVEIKEPVYIISNPRSGTTLLHRLICIDEEKFVHIRMFHTLIPSITFCRIVDFFGAIDQRIGRPLTKMINWLDKILFTGWEDVHAVGFNRSEEDEGLYFLAGISPALSLVTPYLDHFQELYILDHLNERKRERIKNFYKATLQRWMYVLGPEKRFLCKSVMSTGRLQMLTELFPDMKIIYPVRNPYDAVPSFVEMFTTTWRFISPAIPEDSGPYRALANLAITYYQYFNEQKRYFNSENFITLNYDDLIANPFSSVTKIYSYFHFEMNHSFQSKLREETEKTRKYKSKHEYSLAQYGLKKEDMNQALSFIFEEYGFEK